MIDRFDIKDISSAEPMGGLLALLSLFSVYSHMNIPEKTRLKIIKLS